MKNKLFKVLSLLWVITFSIGLIALIFKLATGERLAGYGSYVPWGLWVALYFHAIGISGGVFTVGMIGYFLNINGFRDNLRVILLVSAACVMTGLLAIWLDLGQGFRAYRIVTAPNFGSMMAFNAWMYNIFLASIMIIFFLSLKKERQSDLNDKSGWLVPLLMLGFVLSIMYPSQSGAFFGVVDAKPFWSSALLPILFLVSAITSGSASLLLVFTFLYPENIDVRSQPLRMLRWITIFGVIFYFIAEFAEYSITFWSPNSHIREAVEMVLFGPFWWVFWIVHVGGAVTALYLLFKRKSLPAIGTGAFIVAVTFVSARLNILIPGQAVSELKGLKEAFYHERLRYDYTATTNEYLIALFIGSFGVGLIFFGYKLLSKYTQKKIGRAL